MNHCEYCSSKLSDGATGICPQCGGPIGEEHRDYSTCPFCKRKLLALASIACSYCGKGLPADLLQIRQNLAKTLIEQAGKSYYTDSGSHAFSDDTSTVSSLLAALGIEFRNDSSDPISLLEQLGFESKEDKPVNPPLPHPPVFRRIGH